MNKLGYLRTWSVLTGLIVLASVSWGYTGYYAPFRTGSTWFCMPNSSSFETNEELVAVRVPTDEEVQKRVREINKGGSAADAMAPAAAAADAYTQEMASGDEVAAKPEAPPADAVDPSVESMQNFMREMSVREELTVYDKKFNTSFGCYTFLDAGRQILIGLLISLIPAIGFLTVTWVIAGFRSKQ